MREPRPARPRPQMRRKAFTLIEVLVAGIMLAMSVAVMGTALTRSYAALSEARDERRAAAHLSELLTKVDLIGPSRLASEGPRDGKFDGDDARFSWSMDIRNRPEGHLFQVTVTLSWSDGGRPRSAQVQTYLNDAPKSHDPTLKWRDL